MRTHAVILASSIKYLFYVNMLVGCDFDSVINYAFASQTTRYQPRFFLQQATVFIAIGPIRTLLTLVIVFIRSECLVLSMIIFEFHFIISAFLFLSVWLVFAVISKRKGC